MSYQISWLSVLPKLALSGLVFSLALSHDAEAQVVKSKAVSLRPAKVPSLNNSGPVRAQTRKAEIIQMNGKEAIDRTSPYRSPFRSKADIIQMNGKEAIDRSVPTRTQTLQKARKLPTRSPVKVTPKRPSGNFRR